MLKAILISASLILFIYLPLQVNAAPNSRVYFNPSTTSTTPGSTFTVDSMIDPGVNQVSAVEVHITFDPAIVQLTGISSSSPFSQVLSAASWDNNAGTGTITVGIPTGVQPVTTPSPVATFSFTATAAGLSALDYNQNLTQAAAYNEPGNVIITYNSGTITVVGPSATPTPIPPTATPTPTPVADTLYFIPTTISTTVGQTFSIDSTVSPGSDQITAIEIHVTFDPTVLQLNSITPSSNFSQTLQKAIIDNSAGTGSIIVGVSAGQPVVPIIAVSNAAVFDFATIAASAGTSVSYTSSTIATALNSQTNVLKTLNPASVVIVAPTNILPSSSSNQSSRSSNNSNTSNSSSSSKIGDLNNDGKVNIFDLSIFLSRWLTGDSTADLNHSGKVDIFDLSILLANWTG